MTLKQMHSDLGRMGRKLDEELPEEWETRCVCGNSAGFDKKAMCQNSHVDVFQPVAFDSKRGFGNFSPFLALCTCWSH